MKMRTPNEYSVKSNVDLVARRGGAWVMDSFLVGIFVALIVAVGKLGWDAAVERWSWPTAPEFHVLYSLAVPLVFFLARTNDEARGEQTVGQGLFSLRVVSAEDVNSADILSKEQPKADIKYRGLRAAARNSYLLLLLLSLTKFEPVMRTILFVLLVGVIVFRVHLFDLMAGKRVVVA
ncbi:MAG: hypothetical protein Q4E11_08115 [Corynebacterium sp.]|uniref:hypothetical protein n=1 Tax=Corynebacterium sp. TaxID=1720 RepID=UPI0026DD3FEB|nr:hypothetical protein [Corynebacterium sp.]MDO5030529.1 hypothetical protein [Corynebacterium sp.]